MVPEVVTDSLMVTIENDKENSRPLDMMESKKVQGTKHDTGTFGQGIAQ